MDSGRIFMQITLGINEYMADFTYPVVITFGGQLPGLSVNPVNVINNNNNSTSPGKLLIADILTLQSNQSNKLSTYNSVKKIYNIIK